MNVKIQLMAHKCEERVEHAPQWNNSDVTEDVEYIVIGIRVSVIPMLRR